MRLEHGQVPSFPKISAAIVGERSATVTINGVSTEVTGGDLNEVRARVIGLMVSTAGKLGRPVRALTSDGAGEWPLVVYPDGLVENDSSVEPDKRQGKRKPVPAKRPDTHRTGERPKRSRSETRGPAPSRPEAGRGSEEPVSGPPSPQDNPAAYVHGDSSRTVSAQEPLPPTEAREVPASPVVGSDPAPAAGHTSGTPEFGVPPEPRLPDEPAGADRARVVKSAPQPAPVARKRRAPTPFDEIRRIMAQGSSGSGAPATRSHEARPRTAAAPEPVLTRSESENLWEAAIQDINARHGVTAPVGLRRGRGDRGTGDGLGQGSGVRSSGWTNVPITTHRKIAVLSLKGGVGKTTTALLLGSFLAAENSSRAAVVDMNPDRGTLRDRVPLQGRLTVGDLYRDAQGIRGYTDLRRYMSVNDAGLHSLVGAEGGEPELFAEHDGYKVVSDTLQMFYEVELTDCGTGLGQPGMHHVLGAADQVLIILDTARDAVNSAKSTLEWLDRNGYRELRSTAVVVISKVDPRVVRAAELAELEEYFLGLVRGVVPVPFDEHLARGELMVYRHLSERTRDACARLADLIIGSGSEAQFREGTVAQVVDVPRTE